MPIITNFLLDQDDETLHCFIMFMQVCDFYKEMYIFKFQKFIQEIKWNKTC